MATRVQTFLDYEGFCEKFKPRKTTDDCYTPANVYEAVKAWAVKEYSLQGREVVRPFWPGKEYDCFDYPDGCVVIDNPPLSRPRDNERGGGVHVQAPHAVRAEAQRVRVHPKDGRAGIERNLRRGLSAVRTHGGRTRGDGEGGCYGLETVAEGTGIAETARRA